MTISLHVMLRKATQQSLSSNLAYMEIDMYVVPTGCTVESSKKGHFGNKHFCPFFRDSEVYEIV